MGSVVTINNQIGLAASANRVAEGFLGHGLRFESAPNDEDLAIKRRMVSGEARNGNAQSFLAADQDENDARSAGRLRGNLNNIDAANITSNNGFYRGAYAVDLNGDKKYDGRKDGVLAFDCNHDGKIDNYDIANTQGILKALRGEADFNADGVVSDGEMGEMKRIQAAWGGKLDVDGDGKLNTYEMKKAGFKVLVDNGNGQYRENEVDNVRTMDGKRTQLNQVDIQRNYTEVQQSRRGCGYRPQGSWGQEMGGYAGYGGQGSWNNWYPRPWGGYGW